MCGRFTESRELKDVAARFEAETGDTLFTPSYNIGPGRFTPVITFDGPARHLELMRWGLIPSWAKDEKIAFKTFNARSETVFEKPSFRSAIKKRRCLVPADGYFEWQKTDGGKVPYYIYLKDHPLFAFAGIWESWDKAAGGSLLTTFSILTTTPNEKMTALHHRMPVILPLEAEAAWLDPDTAREELINLFEPFSEEMMLFHRVNPEIGNVRNDFPQLIEPGD